MKPLPTTLLAGLLLGTTLLQGCATALVTGAATSAAVATDRRTAGTVIEDQTIELTASARLLDDPQLAGAHLNVTSYNTVVLLTGEAATSALRARAEEITRGVPKVSRVVNEVAIAAPSSFATRGSDTFITTKAKGALFNIENAPAGFDPLKVKVVTENGSVYLMGLVTRAEAEAVVEKIRRVGGVQRVVNVFEYVK